tara:strand:+ start:3208 stop:3444 length:237 start_codon:yes stop_codon:yes gene_type:complete
MTVTIDKHDGTTEIMPIDEFTRWMCLAEALITIEEKAKELGFKMGDLKKKPLAIGNYIKDRYPSMRHDVECELKLGNI